LRAADIATAALFMRDAENRAFLLKIAEGWRRLAEREMIHAERPSKRQRVGASPPPILGREVGS
jgi:hypothetical protein